MIINVVRLSVGGWAGRGYNGRTVKIFFYKDIHCREDDSLLRPMTTPLGRTSSSLSGAHEGNANGGPSYVRLYRGRASEGDGDANKSING